MSTFSVTRMLHSQLFLTLPYPTKKFTGKTIIVTGSNTGLGLEAARHFVRLDAARVILAVRNLEKGNAAADSIHKSTQRSGVVEVWNLDLDSYASVIAFAARADRDLEALHVVVENAGILSHNFTMSAEDEHHITVNVVSTLMLGILLLPKLRETESKTRQKTVLTFTGSWMHHLPKFPERNAASIFQELAKMEVAQMDDRYPVSKLIQLLLVRELADLSSKSEKGNGVIISTANPGAVKTDIMRDFTLARKIQGKIMQTLLCRSTEEGSRTLVHGAEGGVETHGQYLDDCKVSVPSVFVLSEDGITTQKKLWMELSEKLERIRPGIMLNI